MTQKGSVLPNESKQRGKSHGNSLSVWIIFIIWWKWQNVHSQQNFKTHNFNESFELRLVSLYFWYRFIHLWSYITLRLIQVRPYPEPQAYEGSALIPSPRSSAHNCASLQSPGTQFHGPHGPLHWTHPLKVRSYHVANHQSHMASVGRRFQCPHCAQGPCRRQKNAKMSPPQSQEPINTLFHTAKEVLETWLY